MKNSLASNLGNNLIINPLQDIWARGTSFTNLASGVYGPDRFRTTTNAATMRINIDRSSDVPSESMARYSSLLTLNSAPAVLGADEFYGYIQQIEGNHARKLYDKNAFFSQWIKCNQTGYFALNVGTSVGDQRFASRIHVVANEWKEIKIPISKIETALGGTFENSSAAGLYTSLILDVGSTAVVPVEDEWFLDADTSLGIAGQINFGNTAGIEVYTTQWALHEGLDQIPYHEMHRDQMTESMLCNRYYVRYTVPSGTYPIGFGYVVSSVNTRGFIPTPVRMRAFPTINLVSGNPTVTVNGGNYGVSAITPNVLQDNGIQCHFIHAGSAPINHVGVLNLGGDTIELVAEL